MYIDGFGIAGYRSFGPATQRFGPCSKINLIIGQNNSGKSNILTYLTHRLSGVLRSVRGKGATWNSNDSLDRHLGKDTSFAVELGIDLQGARHAEFIESKRASPESSKFVSLFERLYSSHAMCAGGPIAWFRYRPASGGSSTLEIDSDLITSLIDEQVLNPHEWSRLLGLVGGQGGDIRGWINYILRTLSPAHYEFPSVQLIPAIRHVSGAPDEDLSGSGLVYRLARLQNPGLTEREAVERFREISAFLRDVVGNDTARLEIPHDRTTILVEMDGRLLPLDRLGTGIHQVIILAAAATVVRDQILCIEEPELHLHPGLQKKLLKYLHDHTQNQYFITTHSAHLLDSPGASVFHIRHEDGASKVDAIYTAAQRASICADLGYRASDLLQANAVIWVEGPSDRIYLRHWLGVLAPDFVEGLHYSIMFYGGRLLSHLSATDAEVQEFISLRRLNRYISILIDSDRRSAGASINGTKTRIQREFNEGPGFAWVTKGREIENYIPSELLDKAILATHRSAVKRVESGPFDTALTFRNRAGGIVTDVDKVKIAHHVTSNPAVLDVLDLHRQMIKMVGFIAQANGIHIPIFAA